MADDIEDIETHYQSAIIQTNEALEDALNSLTDSPHQAHTAIIELRAHVVHLYKTLQSINTFYGTAIQRVRQNQVMLAEVVQRLEKRLDEDTD